MATTGGNDIVARISQNVASRPTKRIRAKAKAAGTLMTSLPSVIAAAVKRELASHPQIGWRVAAIVKLLSVGPSGQKRNGCLSTRSFGVKAAFTIHSSGKMVASDNSASVAWMVRRYGM